MATLPFTIARYIRSIWMAEIKTAFLRIDAQGSLLDWNGQPECYGLTELVPGEPITEQLYFLEGLLPVPSVQILESVELQAGCCVHIHLIPHHDETWIIFFDATSHCNKQRDFQQKIQELMLLSYRQSQLIEQMMKEKQKSSMD